METAANYQDPTVVIKAYKNKVAQLTEVDYGDFKRKVNQYLLRIEEHMSAKLRGEPYEIIQKIRERVVYYPEFDIEGAREYTCLELEHLLKSLN